MPNWILEHQAGLRLGAFVGVLLALLAAEVLWPRRAGPMRRALRWPSNFGVVVLDTVVVRLLLPAGAIGAAVWAEARGAGLLHHVELGAPAAFALAFLALDCLIYWQHRLLHRIPALWRLHRMHHSDVEFDASTALRFHPAEIVLSMLIKMSAVVALGAPLLAVLAFEIALNAGAMFNHSNLRLPLALDRAMRRVLVTPDMHRVHHSVHAREYNTNFGFTVPWWDWLFRSYTDQPADGHATMRIGLDTFREDKEQRLIALLGQPGRHPRESGGPAS
jgi:sterol desaturase/sphingolipid hydroxylase (fatty acid hydroxylase superfamily)